MKMEVLTPRKKKLKKMRKQRRQALLKILDNGRDTPVRWALAALKRLGHTTAKGLLEFAKARPHSEFLRLSWTAILRALHVLAQHGFIAGSLEEGYSVS